MLEDKLLIRRIKKGDKNALCRIYEKYKDDLLRVAAGLLKARSDAEDVVHEIFINFVETADRFVLTGSLRGYLMTCVANKARNLNRTQSRHTTVALSEIEPPADRLKRPDEWIIMDETFSRLCEAMTILPYEQREAVILRVQGRMKFSTIAALQETSVKTVLSRYRYGITKLRTLLNGEVEQ